MNQLSNEIMEFIQSVKRKTNIDLSLYKEAQMKRRLTALYEKKGCRGFKEYFNLIQNDREQMEEFLDRMTINVSEFFRNQKRMGGPRRVCIAEADERNKLKVWSAACSDGRRTVYHRHDPVEISEARTIYHNWDRP